MRDNADINAFRFVIVTLDSHTAGPAARCRDRLVADFPGLEISIHAAAEWGENPAALADAKQSIAHANIVVTNLLFLEEHTNAIMPDLLARRDGCDAMINVIADSSIVKLTKMGDLDMSKPASGAMALLKKLRPQQSKGNQSGKSHMKTLRTLPKILRLIPGKSQDLRNWFLSMQYWLGGSDDNIEQMIRMLVSRYAVGQSWKPMKAKPPIEYPEVGVYHPDLPGQHISTDAADLPRPENAVATIGMLMLRSYILSSDTAHYDAVIRAFEEKGMAVIPAFAGGLDGTPAIENYFQGNVDAMVSLTGFSLVGGPAYNDSAAAVKLLTNLDVPYIAAQPLEFQTLGQWAESPQGLGPIETTMLVALPEIDGATNPTVFAGRHGPEGCRGCAKGCVGQSDCKAMAPCHERITSLAEKTLRLAKLRRKQNADKKIGVVLFGFPPNAGAVGTAAYLSVFESLFNTLNQMKADGYTVDVPESVDHLRAMILQGNAAQYGQQANVGAQHTHQAHNKSTHQRVRAHV
ncbi:MAG: cobaltochelatase subunit CobN, partial [Paracoccaceae bacterium]|nr:cobaltochelatase subunit CobN [Paracoccaceae bacterium]